jgi:uncharacterized membrane protein YbhN (UPF0104 family)
MRKWIDYSWDKLNSAYQNQKTRRLLFLGILLLSLFFIALALRANWSEFKAQDLNFDYRFIILAVLIYPVGMLPTALSWHTLLRTIGVALPFRTNLRIFSLSALPRHIPGFVWYISSRSLLYKEENTPAAVIITASAADIILLALTGFLSTLMLLVSGIGISQDLNSIRTAAFIAIPILLLLIISIPLVNRLLPYLLEMRGVTEIPSIHQGYLVVTLLIMFIAWAGGGLILFVLAQAIYPLSWSMYPALIGAWGAAGAVSLTVGIGIQGLGIREITLSAILSLIMPPVIAIILAVVFRLVLTVGEFMWVMLLIWLTKKPPEKNGGSVS